MTFATAKKRLDYQPPAFTIEHVELAFFLEPENTKVVSTCKVKRVGEHNQPLVLDGEQLELLRVAIDRSDIVDYVVSADSLTLKQVPDNFELTIETSIQPAANQSLEGLYLSSGAYCTQCEAEGFRKITYFLDRPDVLATYDVTITAEKASYPYLLSNGNKVGSGELDNGYHWVKWQDPFKKPCYLFALVAGDFDLLTDSFTTASGREVALELFVDKGMAGRGQHALDSLKKSMAWDEQTFGLEYDLDIYMIVAVDFFNMGAMENKGLNIFNSKYVLANSETATDDDYFNIESVIAHEYFHNWTGNRVTCRDWFQLSLKEGLTVFRDQQFSSDMSSPVVNRIRNVKVIREHQFAEDASAMSHPIRPDEVIEMNNFYTVTVYDKGAEVIRMLHTLLGQQGFRAGMDLYFQRFDGQAVTCDDFVQAMEDANQKDLSQFRLWYQQSGTPRVSVRDEWDESEQCYRITLQQSNPPTADQKEKSNLLIPIKMQLVSAEGNNISMPSGAQHSDVVELTEASKQLVLNNINARPVPVLLNDFSAPVMLDYNYSIEQLSVIMMHASDAFSRWDASQTLYSKAIHQLAARPEKALPDALWLCLDNLLSKSVDDALLAEMLTLPSFETLCQQTDKIDVDGLHRGLQQFRQAMADQLGSKLLPLYDGFQTTGYQYQQQQVNGRRLRNVALQYLALTDAGQARIQQQFSQADNMTCTLGALKAAQQGQLTQFDDLMQQFGEKWQDDPLVLDKWFALHATTEREDILARLTLLQSHKNYQINNPNRVRALIGSFTFYNPMGFHKADGSGYRYVCDYLLTLDKLNPQVTARLVTPLTQWQKFDEKRQQLMKAQLHRLLDNKELSKDVFEKVSKSISFEC